MSKVADYAKLVGYSITSDFGLLLEYAKKFKVENIIKKYMEVL